MLSGVPRHRLGFWVTTLTWREHQRLYFGFGSEGCSGSATRNDLVSQNRAIKYNFTPTIRAHVDFIKLFTPVFATSPQVHACGSLYLLIGKPRGLHLSLNGEPRSARLRMVKSLSTAKKRPIQRRSSRRRTMDKDGARHWTIPLTWVTAPHSLLLSPSYLCTTSQCFHTKSIGTV